MNFVNVSPLWMFRHHECCECFATVNVSPPWMFRDNECFATVNVVNVSPLWMFRDNECFEAYIWMSHVTHWDTSHDTFKSAIQHTCIIHPTHQPHTCMSHAPHHIHAWVMSSKSTIHVMHVKETCNTYQWVMWLTHAAALHTCLVWFSHVKQSSVAWLPKNPYIPWNIVDYLRHWYMPWHLFMCRMTILTLVVMCCMTTLDLLTLVAMWTTLDILTHRAICRVQCVVCNVSHDYLWHTSDYVLSYIQHLTASDMK